MQKCDGWLLNCMRCERERSPRWLRVCQGVALLDSGTCDSSSCVGQSDMQLEEEAHGVRRKMQQHRQQMEEFNGDVAATAGMGAQGDALPSEGIVPY